MINKFHTQIICVYLLMVSLILICMNSCNTALREELKSGPILLLNPSWRSVTEYPGWNESIMDNRYDECTLHIDLANTSKKSLKIAVVGDDGLYSVRVDSYYNDGRSCGSIQDGIIDKYMNLPPEDRIKMYVGLFECTDTAALDSIVISVHLRDVTKDTMILSKIDFYGIVIDQVIDRLGMSLTRLPLDRCY